MSLIDNIYICSYLFSDALEGATSRMHCGCEKTAVNGTRTLGELAALGRIDVSEEAIQNGSINARLSAAGRIS